MVHKILSVDSIQSKKPEIIDIHPTSINDIRKSSYPVFVIKFSSVRCAPCKDLELWLKQTYKPKTEIPIYHVNVDKNDGDMVNTLCTLYNVMSVPRIIITDGSLKSRDSFIGFDRGRVESLLDAHFHN